MQLVRGDLWSFSGNHVITTNLTIKKNGEAVLGCGVARQAVERYPALPRLYGNFLTRDKTGTGVCYFPDFRLLCLPVKQHWNDAADLSLIRRSLEQMLILHDSLNGLLAPIYMPVPGIGFGELSKDRVIGLLKQHLNGTPGIYVVERGDGVMEKYPDTFRPGARVDRLQ